MENSAICVSDLLCKCKIMLIVLVLLLLNPVTIAHETLCKTPDHDRVSYAYYDQAETLWNETKFEDSLPFFRAAARLCPESSLFWWKLGIAEWKQRIYGKATTRFERLRERGTISETFPYPDDYEEQSSPPESLKEVLSPSNSITFPPLTEKSEVNLENLGDEDYPFVVRNFLQLQYLVDSNHTLTELLQAFPHARTEFYPQNMLSKPTRVFKRSLKEALEFFYYPEGAYTAVDISEPGTYIQWNLNFNTFQILLAQYAGLEITEGSLKNDLFAYMANLIGNLQSEQENARYTSELLKYITAVQSSGENEKKNLFELFAQQTHWYMMLIGEEKAGMFHHIDNLPIASWQIQLAGKKKWVLCRPNFSLTSVPSKEELFFEAEERCREVILHQGDLLFYPKYYSHETHCLSTPTLSISGTLIPHRDYPIFNHFICDECDKNEVGYQFHSDFCRLISPSCPQKIPFEVKEVETIVNTDKMKLFYT